MVMRSHEGRQIDCNTRLNPATCNVLGDRFNVVELPVVAYRDWAVSSQHLVFTVYLRARTVHRVGHEITHSPNAAIVNLDQHELRADGPLVT